MSNTTHDPLPIDQTPVGELLGEELEARGWSQADFAAVIDRPTQFVSEIVTGKKEITRESAAQIGAALSQSAEYWLKLQDQYLLAEQARTQRPRRSWTTSAAAHDSTSWADSTSAEAKVLTAQPSTSSKPK